MRYLLYYLLLILVLIFISPKIKHALDSDIRVVTTSVVDSVDTRGFQEGQIIILDEVGCLRIVFPRDSSSRILGIVTRCDSIGEITLKYIVCE